MRISVAIHDQGARKMLDRLDAGMRQAVHDSLWRGALELSRVAQRNAPKAFSTLRNSIHVEEINPLHFRVATGVNYARFVEEGRRPGKQPGTANGLMEWVRLKTGLQGKDLDRKTYVIARAIGIKGIAPQPYMQPAYDSEKDRIIANVQASARRAAQEAQRV